MIGRRIPVPEVDAPDLFPVANSMILEEEMGLSLEAFYKIRDHYWVLDFVHASAPARWMDWRFGLNKPRPVMNPTMQWRRPTYEEANLRQEAYEQDPVMFEKLCKDKWSTL